MRMGKFLRAKYERAIFEVGMNFVAMLLQLKRKLNQIGDASCHNRGLIEMKSGQITQESIRSERGDVPGWVLVVLMTTGLVTAIWTIAAPRLSAILRNSLDAMNGIR